MPQLQITPSFTPSPADTRILMAVNDYDVMTAEQVCGLLYSETSITTVRARLFKLAEEGYLYRVPFTYRRMTVQDFQRGGSSPALYTISGKTWTYLKSFAHEPLLARFHATERRERKQLTMEHTLTTNETLIRFVQLTRTHPQLKILRIKHEWELNRNRSYVHKTAVIPDGWIELQTSRIPPVLSAFALEIDMGTMKEKDFKEKIHTLVRWSYEPYKAYFGTDNLEIAWFAVSGEKRCNQLLTWCEQALSEHGLKNERTIFLFAGIDPRRASPESLLLDPIWQNPFDRQPMPLLNTTN